MKPRDLAAGEDSLPKVPIELYDLTDQYGSFAITSTYSGQLLQGSRAVFYAIGGLPIEVDGKALDEQGRPYVSPPQDPDRYQAYKAAMHDFEALYPDVRDPRVRRKIFAADQDFVRHHLRACPGCEPPAFAKPTVVDQGGRTALLRPAVTPWANIHGDKPIPEGLPDAALLVRQKTQANPFMKENKPRWQTT
jgi:hypothetical protein